MSKTTTARTGARQPLVARTEQEPTGFQRHAAPHRPGHSVHWLTEALQHARLPLENRNRTRFPDYSHAPPYRRGATQLLCQTPLDQSAAHFLHAG
jgi:hypothetical protein